MKKERVFHTKKFLFHTKKFLFIELTRTSFLQAKTRYSAVFLPLLRIAGNVVGRAARNGGHGLGIQKDVSYTLTATDRHAVYSERRYAKYGLVDVAMRITAGRVRRLTPLECERLQGLPDDWTSGGSDSARYRAIGSGMAQPCADWIIKRIVEVGRDGYH